MSHVSLVHQLARTCTGILWVGRNGEQWALIDRIDLSGGLPNPIVGELVQAARACRGVRSLHVIRADDVVLGTGQFSLYSAYVESIPLRTLQFVARVRGVPFPLAVSLRILVDAVDGLMDVLQVVPDAYGGVVPERLMVGTDGVTRVAAIPISAVAAGREPWLKNVERVGYLAPEQLETGAVLGETTDVYAVGILLWELLAHRKLFSGSAARIIETISRKRIGDIPPVEDSHIPDALFRLLEKALQPERLSRYSRLSQLREALISCGVEVARVVDVAGFVEEIGAEQLRALRKAVEVKGGQRPLGLNAIMDDFSSSTKPSSVKIRTFSTIPPAIPADARGASAVGTIGDLEVSQGQTSGNGSIDDPSDDAETIAFRLPAAGLVSARESRPPPASTDLQSSVVVSSLGRPPEHIKDAIREQDRLHHSAVGTGMLMSASGGGSPRRDVVHPVLGADVDTIIRGRNRSPVPTPRSLSTTPLWLLVALIVLLLLVVALMARALILSG